LKELNDTEVNAIFSMSNKECSFIWDLLKRGITKGKWNACSCESGLLMSIYQSSEICDEWNGKEPFHLVGTNWFSFCYERFNEGELEDIDEKDISQYTEDYLNGKTVANLKEICKEYNLLVNGKKEDIIKRVMRFTNKWSEQKDSIDNLLDKIETRSFNSKPPHHQFYRENFNHVDRHDRYHFICCAKFKVTSWETKMLPSILTDIIANSWVMESEFTRLELPVFRILVATELLKFK
jgi:hypothetical protein